MKGDRKEYQVRSRIFRDMRAEDISYYRSAAEHQIEKALSGNPDWQGKNPGWIIKRLKEDYWPFKENRKAGIQAIWREALNNLRKRLLGERSEAPEAVDEIFDPGQILEIMQRKGITIKAAAAATGLSPLTIASMRGSGYKRSNRVTPKVRKLLDFLENAPDKPVQFETFDDRKAQKQMIVDRDASLKIFFHALADKCDEIGGALKDFGDLLRRFGNG